MIDFGGVTKIDDVSLVFGLASGTTITVDAEHIALNGIVFDSATSVDGQFSIGSAVTGKLSLILLNDDDSLSSYDFRDATVTVFFTMEGAADPTQMGLYIVNEFRYDGSNISLTAYDYMSRFDYPCTYVGSESEITFPATLLTIIQKAADVCDVSLLNRTTPFPNASFVVDQKPQGWDTMTWHDVVGYCAQIAGVYARMDRYANLMFGWYEIPDAEDATQNTMDYHTLEENYALSVDVSDVTITGLQVVLEPGDNIEADSDTTTYTTVMYGSEGYTVTISDNPLIQTKAQADSVKDYLGARIVGMTFRPLNGTMVEDPSIEAGDTALVSGVGDKVYQCFISRVTYTTHASTIIACDAEGMKSALSKRFSRSAKISSAVDQVRREVDSVATLAGNTTQYFWFTETGNDTGAHITRIPQEDFVDNPSMGNLLARDNGIAIRNGMTEYATFDVDGVTLKDGNGIQTAHFGNDAVIGYLDESHVTMTDEAFRIFNDSQVECFKVSSSGSSVAVPVYMEDSFPGEWYGYDRILPLTWHIDGFASLDKQWKSFDIYLILLEAYTRTSPSDTDYKWTIVVGNGEWDDDILSPGVNMAVEYTLIPEVTKTVTLLHNGYTYTITMLAASGSESYSLTITVSAVDGDGNPMPPYDSTYLHDLLFAPKGRTYYNMLPAPTYQIGSLSAGGEVGAYSAGIGYDVNPSGDYSAAIGQGVTAASNNQIAIGKYNNNDSGNIFEIGNGTSGSPSNALTVSETGSLGIGNPGGTFKVTEHTVSTGSVAANGYHADTATVTYAGYYPLGVVGYNCTSRYLCPTRFYISGAAVGSGTLNYMVYNPTSNARTATCTMRVLWVKAT